MSRLAPAVTIVLAILAIAGTAGAGHAGQATTVLGSKSSFVPSGRGWGIPRPVSVDDGGDPSGKAWSLHWTDWGRRVAHATGFTFLSPTPSRGWRKGRLQFRASRIRRCAPAGHPAYTRLEVRVAELRSGAFSAWQLWNGRPNLCHH